MKVDVLICGCGSAGVCAATWLARCGLRCKILDSRDGPLAIGQADGVQCRTVEVFESFGLAEELLRDGCHVLEVCFWSTNSDGKLVRTKRAADTPAGLSHQPHLILNQARVHSILLEGMYAFNRQEVDYGYKVESVQVDSAAAKDPNAYCVTVVATKDGKEERIDAKYVLGCDGAHSAVRHSLGFRMIGDSTDAVWGVMDIYPRTDFPDIRKKVVLQTQNGNLLIIPREGGSMVRFYIELERGIAAKEVRLEDLHAAARRVLSPFKLDFAATPWWSAYSIGQRLANHFSKDNRVFLTGDACHTHSPKAGQGMNVSLQDGYNIGWKLAAILKSQASPDLLHTYNLEREKVAATLIDFDRAYAKSFSTKNAEGGESFSDLFVQAARYTAGLAARYDESPITNLSGSTQNLAANLTVGMRFPSTKVVRFCDARVVQLVTAMPADGRWRIVLFVGDVREAAKLEKLHKIGEYLFSNNGLIQGFTPDKADIDSFIEVLVVLSGVRQNISDGQIPLVFSPITGEWRIRDLHKVFVDETNDVGQSAAYEFYGIDSSKGAVAIVRPDQYIAMVTGIDDYDGLKSFFSGWAKVQK